ncbi:MAG: hypothetical protein ACOX6V_01335 [Patescibacteria group bacterium]|jgi:hypothetical protein
MKIFEKVTNWYKDLPEKKRYLEFISAVLSIGVMLTVIVNNVDNINSRKSLQNAPDKDKPTPTPQVIRVEVDKNNSESEAEAKSTQTPSVSPKPTPEPTAAPKDVCKKEVGPIEIVYPEENEVISSDPVCIDISHKREEYCAVVWAYRINGSNWSDYTDKSICLYNVTPGEKLFELRVKSIVSGDEILLKRRFTVEGRNPESSPESSPSAQAN